MFQPGLTATGKDPLTEAVTRRALHLYPDSVSFSSGR
jgi:hypothetical protein